jgi:hypothetical protein
MTDPRFTDPRLSDPMIRRDEWTSGRDENVGGMWSWVAGVSLLGLLLRPDGLVAAGTARWRDHRHISARRGRLPDLRVNMFWRANHPAGAPELVAQIFLSILALRVNFAALPNRGLRARFRAFRIYLLSRGRDRRFR